MSQKLLDMMESKKHLMSIWKTIQLSLETSSDSSLVQEHTQLASKEISIAMDEAQKYIHEMDCNERGVIR